MRAVLVLWLFALVFAAGYYAGISTPQAQLPATTCPQPKTEPERCMAFWFGRDSIRDKDALRRQVCGQDPRDSRTPRK